MAAMSWENALATFADTKEFPSITQRATVAADGTDSSGNGGYPWFTPSERYVWTNNQDLSSLFDFYWSVSFDTGGGFYNSTTLSGKVNDSSGSGIVYTTWIGFKANQAAFTTGSPYDGFITQPATTWQELLYGPSQNNTTSVWSFDAASQLIRDLDVAMSGWQQSLNSWRDTVGDPTSDWQGSAANEFRVVLDMLINDFNSLQTQLDQHNLAPALDSVRQLLGQTNSQLYTAYWNWRADTYSNPLNCLAWAISVDGGMAGASATGVFGSQDHYQPSLITVNTPYGVVVDHPDSGSYYTPGLFASNPQPDSGHADFWNNLKQGAWNKWLDSITRLLDPTANNAMGTYANALNQLTDAIPSAFTLPPNNLPGITDTGNLNANLNANANANANANLNANANGNANAGGNGNTTVTSGPATNGGNGNASPNMPGTNGNPNTGVTPPPFLTTSTSTSTSSSSSTGNSSGNGGMAPLLGADGQPLSDRNGIPIMVPAGSTIGKNGELIGPNGEPVLVGGQPYFAPPGSKVGSSPNPFGGIGFNTPMKVPPGSHINADGTVTAPDGKLVTDSNGNKVILSHGSTLAADGTVLDSGGNPVSQQTQLLADEQHALPLAPPPFASSGFGAGGPPTTSSGPATGAGAGAGAVTGTAASTESTGLSQSVTTVGGGNYQSGVNEQNLAEKGLGLNTDQTAQAALAAASGDASAAGEMPMTQSMGGMGMGGMGGLGGGIGNPSGQDRQRTTWLTEDEEAWGTETEGVRGVIGR
ncbi:hypothetical protein [Streptacidiphilus fuscans]|uniref:Uncharacterized protein n=1 Tax=Streptacidiphilus fuscans TaxID=2789292 RepID=A0A931FF76_9ACTN|nr:hypothetical protein [Streptacidiphilus fuscans]MBF9072572.1 hypothetical protein [Streptacidiphilus fuscans]